MSRMSRALIAGGAALALLAGSGATFARWYDEKPLAGAAVTTGTLRLLDSGQPDVWKVAHSNDGTSSLAESEPSEVFGMAQAKVISDPASFQMVPGDYVVLKRTVKLNLVGDNLQAQFGVLFDDKKPHPEGITTNVVGNCEGKSGNIHLTEADDGKTCEVLVSFIYPFGPGDDKNHGAGLNEDHSGKGWHAPEGGMNKTLSVAGAKLVLEQESAATAPRP